MTESTTQPTYQEIAISAKKSDLDILNWMANMIPIIQERLGRSDQEIVRLEWTKDGKVLCTALYPTDPAPATTDVPEPAEEPTV